jgi:hypothetical protein
MEEKHGNYQPKYHNQIANSINSWADNLGLLPSTILASLLYPLLPPLQIPLAKVS